MVKDSDLALSTILPLCEMKEMIENSFAFLKFNQWFDVVMMAFLIFFAIQIFYYLFFFGRLAFYKNKEQVLDDKLPISVVICAKNERDNLLEFLPEIFKQDYPQFEVVVVNDNSLDDTEEVLKAFSLQHKNLKIVNIPDNDRFFGSKKFALTLGIKAAQYDHILLTDADCKPASKNWIKSMSEFDTSKQIILGYGAYQTQKGLLNKLIRFETFFTAVQYLSYALAKLPYMGVGRNLAYDKVLFFKNKGFASHQHILSGDDDLFVNEVATSKNTKIVVGEEFKTISLPKTSFKSWIKQKKRHLSTGIHYKFSHKFLLGLFQFSQLIFVVSFFILAIKNYGIYLIITILVLKYFIQIFVYWLCAKKIGEKDIVLFIPLFELFFIIFNPLLVISNLVIKNTKWS